MSKPFPRLVALCVLTFFLGLGRSPITDSDEAFYAESARQMVAVGDWLTPHYNATVRFEKPVLMYWMVATSYLVAGVGEAAARFPSALAGLALVLLTYSVARRWCDSDTGFLAGAIVATTFGTSVMARQALPDLPVTTFIVFATWALIRALSFDPVDATSDQGVDTPAHRRKWLLAAAFASALAFLTKGPIGVLLPAIVAVPLAYYERRGRNDASSWHRWPQGLTASTVLIAVLVFLAITAPWFLAMWSRHGSAHLVQFFATENVARFTTAEFNEPRPILFYLPVLAGGLFPWTPFAVLWLPGIVRMLRSGTRPTLVSVRLIFWAIAPLVFYTLSIGKQPRYILPILTPLAILLARAIRKEFEVRLGSSQHLFRAVSATAVAVWLALGLLLFRATPILEAAGSGHPSLPALTLFGVAFALSIVLFVGALEVVPVTVTIASALTVVVLHYQVFSPPRPAPVEQVAATISAHWRPGYTVGAYRAFGRNQIFYSEHPRQNLATLEQAAAFLDAPTPMLCIIPESDLLKVNPRITRSLRHLDRVAYVDTAGFRIRDLLQPDAESVRRIVLVVTNR